MSLKSVLSSILPSYIQGTAKPNPNKKQIQELSLVFMSLHHGLTGKKNIEVDDMAFHRLLRSDIARNPEFGNAGFKEEDIYSFLGLSKEQYNSGVYLTQDQEFDIHLGYYLLFAIRVNNRIDNFDLEKIVLEDLILHAEYNIPESEKEIKSRIFDLTREDFNKRLDRLKNLLKKEQ